MAKQITLEEIKSLKHDRLASMLYGMLDSNNVLYDKLEKMILSSNPKELTKSIKKDIASIRRGRKFIGYYEAFEYAQTIAGIVESIEQMVEDEVLASTLFKELILTDSKVYLRSDDSSGTIQISYARAEDGWAGCLAALSDEQIYADIMEMLVCEGFGVRGVFSEHIPVSVLERLHSEFLVTTNLAGLDDFDRVNVLQLTAHFLKDPKRYIVASKLHSRAFIDSDMIDFAREYKYADDAEGVLVSLGKIQTVDKYKADDFYTLQVWAYETLNDRLNVTLAYKNWYEKSKEPSVFKKYLARLDGVMQEKVKKEALKDAENLGFSEALQFFHSLDEKTLAANYIESKQKALQTQSMYADGLKNITKWLRDAYPQECILLYRDSCESALATSSSKHYPRAIKALKECLKLEKENDTLSWYIEDNDRYLETLINTHKRKPKFVELFFKAFG